MAVHGIRAQVVQVGVASVRAGPYSAAAIAVLADQHLGANGNGAVRIGKISRPIVSQGLLTSPTVSGKLSSRDAGAVEMTERMVPDLVASGVASGQLLRRCHTSDVGLPRRGAQTLRSKWLSTRTTRE